MGLPMARGCGASGSGLQGPRVGSELRPPWVPTPATGTHHVWTWESPPPWPPGHKLLRCPCTFRMQGPRRAAVICHSV